MPVQVATLQLPAGSHVISTTFYMHSTAAGSFTTGVNCTLAAGSDSDRSKIQTQATGGSDVSIPMSLSLTHVANSSFVATLTCEAIGPATVSAVDTDLTAIQVGSLTS